MPISARVSLPVEKIHQIDGQGHNDAGLPATVIHCEVSTDDAQSIIRAITSTELSIDGRSSEDALRRLNDSDIVEYVDNRIDGHFVCTSYGAALCEALSNLDRDAILPDLRDEIWWTFYNEESVHGILTDDELTDIVTNMRLDLLENALYDRGYTLSAKD